MTTSRLGEVIDASTLGFGAQCYELHQPPPLGSLVRTREGGTDTFAVVYNVATTSLEPGRLPLALGREEEDQEAIYKSHPQLSQLLRTNFQAVIVGHSTEAGLFHRLPPHPPRLHSFVHLCSQEEARRFSSALDFLSLLVDSPLPGRDEVIAACLRQLSQAQGDGRTFLVAAGKELALLLAGQGVRLYPLLRKLHEP